MTTRCPFCGNELSSVHSGWQRQEMTEYHYGGPISSQALVAPGTTWTRKEPARPPVAADVGVPAAWAGLTGVALSLLAIPVTIWQRWPWWVPVVALSGGGGLTWVILLVRWQHLLWRVEEIIGVDLDGDHQKGKPVQVEVTDREARQMRLVDLPVSDDVLRSVAKAVMGGRAFSRRALAGIISEGDFNKLQGAMIGGGLARYKGDGPTTGVELSPAGRALFQHYL